MVSASPDGPGSTTARRDGERRRAISIFGVSAHRDVVVALLEASASLSGLLLVFLGFVVNTYTGMASGTAAKARTSLERAAIGLLIAFVIGLSCVALATVWLVAQEGDEALFTATAWLFGVQLTGLAVATVWAIKAMLWIRRRSAASGAS
jgi:hypothetical protein